MKFVDLGRQYEILQKDIQSRINAVLDHGRFIMGDEVMELEGVLAKFCDAKHCIAVSSGTDALQVALMALGVSHGDEVILPAFSFFATAEVVLLLGATPVFVDIDPVTYNMDMTQVEAKITDKTRAIIPVDLYGQSADYTALNDIASRHNIPVIGDSAQSYGATFDGKKVGSMATITATSFFPSKPLGCYGDGGACFTNDDELAEKMRQIRVHGQHNRYEHVRLGLNARFDTIQAAVLLSKMKVFPDEIKSRQKAAVYYDKILGDFIKVPSIDPRGKSVFAQYTVEVDNRDAVQEVMRAAGVPTAVHYPASLNKQPLFKDKSFYNEDYPMSDRAASRVMSLPMHPYLTHDDQDKVAAALKDAIS